MINTRQQLLGLFKVESQKLYISDPCYEYNSVGALTLENVLNGQYIALLRKSNCDRYIKNLKVYHKKYFGIEPLTEYGKIAVDSGQAGIFDNEYYQQNEGGEYDNLDSLYGLACGLTDSENQGGILKDFGVVTVAGFGDGEYKVMIGKNHEQKIISVSIIFLEDEEY